MGMFDDLRCEMRLPAKPDSRLRGLGYQTKDLDCTLAQIVIRADGRLVDENVRLEKKPGAPDAPEQVFTEWVKWRDEWFERKVGPDIPLNYTGSINFYGDCGGWVEFCAFVENGTVTKIVPVELPKQFQKSAA